MSFLTRVATFAVLDTCTAVDFVHTGTRVGAGNGSKSERRPFGRRSGADGTRDMECFWHRCGVPAREHRVTGSWRHLTGTAVACVRCPTPGDVLLAARLCSKGLLLQLLSLWRLALAAQLPPAAQPRLHRVKERVKGIRNGRVSWTRWIDAADLMRALWLK